MRIQVTATRGPPDDYDGELEEEEYTWGSKNFERTARVTEADTLQEVIDKCNCNEVVVREPINYDYKGVDYIVEIYNDYRE